MQKTLVYEKKWVLGKDVLLAVGQSDSKGEICKEERRQLREEDNSYIHENGKSSSFEYQNNIYLRVIASN